MLNTLRLSGLREAMAELNTDAYLITSNDPHLSEYPPERWQSIRWLTGFTGSTSTLMVTHTHAAIWVDSRYYIQAERELTDKNIEICRVGEPPTPTKEQWLLKHLNKGQTVAFDGETISHSSANKLIDSLSPKGITIEHNPDLINKIWTNRPTPPASQAYYHHKKYSGEDTNDKLKRVREQLKELNADTTIITQLDEVAWVLNIRGNDIEYNPLVLAYAIVTDDDATLFTNMSGIDGSLMGTLNGFGVDVKPYDTIWDYIRNIPPQTSLMLDKCKVNHRIVQSIPYGINTVDAPSIPSRLKAVKNSVELSNTRDAMVADGLAMCQFIIWLENNLGDINITEHCIAEKLRGLRSKHPDFVSESFATIAAYADHGAIVHYSPTPATCYTIKPKGFLLIDSGGQYRLGTTDITRTLHLGNPTQKEMRDYTLVLKGMINLSMAKFPEGTRGSQLDALARVALWKDGLNYGHGTGHGVGSFLGVHEGPQSISPRENPVAIEAGMLLTNEPGLYRTNMYGIRIENMMLCTQRTESEFGTFLGFESLTLCPIDVKPIEINLLTIEEKQWLNNYHQMVFDKLSAELNAQEKQWLQMKTQIIQ